MFPLTVFLSLGVVQLVLYAHARDVVTSSVQEAARLAAEDGRDLDDGFARARALASAGLGASADPIVVDGSTRADVVRVSIDAALHPILPVPLPHGLPLHAEASVTRERFRPGGS